MRKYIFLKNSRRIISLVILPLILSYTTEKQMPWYLDTNKLWEDYRFAVVDARTAEPTEICYTLPSINSTDGSSRIEWGSQDGRKTILVASLKTEDETCKWNRNGSVSNNSTIWVTLPYDLEDHIRRLPQCADSLECRMRMLQLIGLPPNCKYDRVVFFYVQCDRLFRPSPDLEIDDTEAGIDFPDDASEHHRRWFAQNMYYSYESETPYPWTRLGYTYNWNREAESVVGPGEFVVYADTPLQLKREVTIWMWYKEIVESVAP